MMPEIFQLETLLDMAERFGYGAVFGGILLENAGIPLPGETLVLAAGFLAGNHKLAIGGVWLAAVTGAILGDSGGYWLGRWGGEALWQRLGKWCRLPPQEWAKAREQFAGNAERAVFLGRFVTLLRIFAGPLAGISGMPYPRFLLWNVLGALLWATVMTGLAFLAGQWLPLTDLVNAMLRFGLLALGAVLIWAIAPALWAHRPR
ncbi:MAG: DedA family protein [Pseudanabaenaceae cyanobacterium]